MNPTPTAEEQLFELEARRQVLLAQVQADRANERPNALKTAQALIDKHRFTAADLKLARQKRAAKKAKPAAATGATS